MNEEKRCSVPLDPPLHRALRRGALLFRRGHLSAPELLSPTAPFNGLGDKHLKQEAVGGVCMCGCVVDVCNRLEPRSHLHHQSTRYTTTCRETNLKAA